MESKVGGFNPDEYNLGMQLWEQVALLPRLTPEQIASNVRVIGRREEQYLEYLRTSPDAAREELARNKAELLQRKGSNPSRPNLTAEKILHGIYYPVHNAALEAYKDPAKSKHVFISWYDYGSGIVDVVNGIFEAEQDNEGVTDQHALETVAKMEEKYRDNPLSIDASSRLYLFHMNKAKRNARLLMEDPTGNKLIENSVNEIRQDAARPPRERIFHRFDNYQEPQMVLAGAQFVQRAYQTLYPLTEHFR
jgi:hypothetical protein